MESSRLRWSQEEMSLRRFVEKYSRSLPMILLTTCGYMDVDNMNEVSADQIFWIYDVFCQQRVIAKTEDMRYLSIPLNYTLKFQRLTRRDTQLGPVRRLDEILGDDVPGGQRIKLAAGRSILFDFCTDGIGECNAELGVLEVRDVYTEKYLLAYTVNEDEWVSQVIGLPVYLPIRVKVATGLVETGAAVAFQQWKQQQTKMCASFGRQTFTPCKEILLFERPPVDNYEYINPCKYARSETAEESDSDDDFDDDDIDNAYEEVSSSPSTESQPTASSKQLYSQPANMVASKIPVKEWRSFENDSRRTPLATGEYVNIEPCVDRRNSIQKKNTKEPASNSLSPTQAPVNKEPPRGDNMIYEDVEDLIPSLTVRPKPKPRQHTGDLRRTSPAQHETDLQCTSARVDAEPAKKTPPPTKPKSFKRKQVSASASSADTEKGASVCRVNPVKPFANGDSSPGSQSSTSSGLWKSARDVPTNVENLSVEQVGECMELLHLPKLAAAFRSQDVDGKLLVSIVSEEVLVTDFGCRVFDAKKVVQFVNNGWRPNE